MNNYEKLTIEIIYISSEDIITTSYNTDEEFDGKDDNVNEW